MKRILILICGLAMMMPAFAGAPEEDVRAAEQMWIDGITKNDFALLGKVLADDLYYLHSNTNVDTKASYIESLRSGKSRYVAVKMNDMKVRVYGNAAVINGDAYFDLMNGGTPSKAHLKYTHVFIKGKGGWQLVSHQSLRLPE